MGEGKVDSQLFLEKFVGQFEDLPIESVSLQTEFRQLPDWSSMQSLVVIASFDWEYGATVSAEELKAAKTIDDLYQLVIANSKD